jgi:hypothetical protein
LSRRSVPAKALAERKFGVRVHVRIPLGGFAQTNELSAYLRQALGQEFYLGSERGFGSKCSSMVIYANDLDAVSEAVRLFGCEVNAIRLGG